MKLNTEEIKGNFCTGIDCSQIVFAYGAEKLGFDVDTAKKIASAFGGGMWQGETCGAVAGALMAIGLKYGHTKPGDAETKNVILAKKAAFEEAFRAANGTLVCRELLGHNLAYPDGMKAIMEQNLLMTKCPCFVQRACEILDEIL